MLLRRLDDLEHDVSSVLSRIEEVRIQVVSLQIKAGIWGALAGAIPALLAAFALWYGGKG